MYLSSVLEDAVYCTLVSVKSVAAANIVYQPFSLTDDFGIIRHQESFCTVPRFFVNRENYIWTRLWFGISFLCMIIRVLASTI